MNIFSLNITPDISNRLIQKLSLSLNTTDDILKILESDNKSFLETAAECSEKEFFFLNYWKKITSGEKIKDHLILTAPFSQDFLQFLGEIPCSFSYDTTNSLEKSTKAYSPKLILNIAESSISFKKNEQSLLLPAIHPLVIINNKICPLHLPFSSSICHSLYENNKTILETTDSIFLTDALKNNNKYFASMISAPKIIESDDISTLFEFHYNAEKYEISIFIEASVNNKIERYHFPLEASQQSIKNNQPITLSHQKDNSVLIIATDHPLRRKIENIVSHIFKNFYSLLGEISDNQIITNDRNNLFESFLPKVAEDIQLVKAHTNKKIRFILETNNPEISIKNTSKTPLFGSMDWLSVDFEFDKNDIKLSLKDLAHIITYGFVETDDALISFPEEQLDPLKKLLELSRIRNPEQIEIQASFLPWLLSLYPQADIPKEWEDLKQFILHNTIPEVILTPFAEETLRDYQKTGVKRLSLLHKFGFGSVLADEMGLGKTLQILTLLDMYGDEGQILIVTPSALTLNWKAEIDKFYPNRFKTTIVQGSKESRNKKLASIKDYNIIITSYHTLGSDQELYSDLQFQFLIIDEAQHIKNKNARRSKSVKTINARSRIAVSGTPLENNISELWSIFDFIMPGFLGTHKHFQQNFEDPLKNFNNDKRKQILSQLQHMTAPFIIRRTKANTYKELPPKIEQTIITELTTKQKTLYLETLSHVRSNFLQLMETKSFNQSRIDFLSTLTKLRQIALHPALVYPELLEENSDIFSSKITILLELLHEAFDSGHRVLIFSQFVSMLAIIKKELQKEDIDFLYIDGKTTNRVELSDQFNAGSTPVFLISLKAGGVGLNLTGADTVILFDPWWNPSVENQAIDRAHRIGQENIVNVYRLMTKGTIEEKIYNLQRKKAFLFDNLMQENPSFEEFSSEELLSLLNIDEELLNE